MDTLPPNQHDTMFKFVNNDPSNPTGKRKQSQRACQNCRKRKKRCYHNDAGSNARQKTSNVGQETSNIDSSLLPPFSPATAPGTIPNDHQSTPNTNGLHQSPAVWVSGPPTTSELAASTPRPSPLTREENPLNGEPERDGSASLNSQFIGDLNPEGIFLTAMSPNAIRSAVDDGVGVWLAKALTSKGLQPASELPISSQSSLFYGSASLLPKVLVPVLEEETLSTLPPPPSIMALSNMYFEILHPIIPLIDQNRFENLPTTDPRRILLQQGICLAASKSFISNQHLILPGSDSPLTYREFGNRLSAAMRLILELGLVTDKIIRIQAFGLMSHFTNGPDNGDVASQLLSRAMQHTVSLGLHQQGHYERDADQYGITLFCSLWALDRMNAAFGGRPVMMHDRDIGWDLERCFESQQPCFRLILEVTLLLDKVIRLYTPSYSQENSELKFEFPSFEELVTKCTVSHISTQFLGKLNIYGLLSCQRASKNCSI